MGRWSRRGQRVPRRFRADIESLIDSDECKGVFFTQKLGGGCGGAWDTTYMLYILKPDIVELYSVNDCSCNEYIPGTSWFDRGKYKQYSFALYQLEQQANPSLPPIPV